MEELLKSIETGFKLENDSFVESVKSRNLEVTSYYASLGKVREGVRELANQLRTEIAPLQKEKEDLLRFISQAKEGHEKNVQGHDSVISDKKSAIEKIDKELEDKNLKNDSLNKANIGLIEEKKELERYITEKRGENQHLDRSNQTLKDEEKSLTKSLEAKRTEDTGLTQSIEDKKKEYAKITEELAIIANRK